jgi:hypothetical protein
MYNYSTARSSYIWNVEVDHWIGKAPYLRRSVVIYFQRLDKGWHNRVAGPDLVGPRETALTLGVTA